MLLCLDVGNSTVYGGLFNGPHCCLKMRYAFHQNSTSDQLGVFLCAWLRDHQFQHSDIRNIAMCSVVPELGHEIKETCRDYFQLQPFVLNHRSRINLKIAYEEPSTLGVDRIATAIGALEEYPHRNLLIADFGTATTLSAISYERRFLGGTIMPGLQTSMHAMENRIAKLTATEIQKPLGVLGKNTAENMQSGLFYGQLGAIKELSHQISEQYFQEPPLLIATGGYADLFKDEGLFDTINGDLVLQGLYYAFLLSSAHRV